MDDVDGLQRVSQQAPTATVVMALRDADGLGAQGWEWELRDDSGLVRR